MAEFEDDVPVLQNQSCVKLFVGQIPREMDEDTLIPYFAEFGAIVELTVIRDRVTKVHKGCAFVTYLDAESAQAAIEQLHDKIKLGGAINPLQVRVAECQVERENKLFIGMLPKTVNEEQLHDMFVKFGDLREVHIIRGPEGSSKGCAFVKFVERDAAIIAIEEMNNKIPEGSTRPLVIKFADVKKHGKKIEGDEIYLTEKLSGLNIKDPNYWPNPQISPQNFSYPYNYQGNLQVNQPQIVPIPQTYVQYPAQLSPRTDTSPYIIMNNIPQTYQTMNNLSTPHIMNDNRIKSYSLNQFSNDYDPRVRPNVNINTKSNGYPNDMPVQGNNGPVVSPVMSLASPTGTGYDSNDNSPNSPTRPPEGPTGANLFIYHLPRDLTDADLATLFAPFGNVISAKVFVDKKTSDSKGFGFVSFDSIESADAAIQSMNGFQIGSKRLKVQHKRTGDDGMMGNPSMMMQDNNAILPMQILPQPHTYIQGYVQSNQPPGRALTHVPMINQQSQLYGAYRNQGNIQYSLGNGMIVSANGIVMNALPSHNGSM